MTTGDSRSDAWIEGYRDGLADKPDPLADAFQVLLDLVETYGGERMQEQQAMWGPIEDAVRAVGAQGIAAGRRAAFEYELAQSEGCAAALDQLPGQQQVAWFYRNHAEHVRAVLAQEPPAVGGAT